MGALVFLKRILDVEVALTWLARLRPQSLPRVVLIGILAAVAALAFRWAGSAFYGVISGFTILVPGVMLAALAGGRIAGATATLVCLAGGFFILSAAGGSIFSLEGRVAAFNFILASLIVTLAGASLRKALARLDSTIHTLEASRTRAGETESQLSAMVAQAAAGIVRCDLDGRVLSANARFCEMLGRSEDAIVGHLIDEFTHPDDLEKTHDLIRDGSRLDSEQQLEKRYLRADGSAAWFLLSVRTLRDPAGTAYGFMTVAVETTALVQARSELRESEERFRLMADTAPSPVWLTDVDGAVEFANAALVKFYGRGDDQIMGHSWRDAIHPYDRLNVADAQLRARPKLLPYGFECRFRRFDGVWRWMRVAVNPRFDALGVFKGYVGLSFDTTDTREALDALAAQERRQTFLLDLADRARNLSTVEEIMAEVQASLGSLLGVNRVGHGEIDQADAAFVMSRDWTDGTESLEGRHRIADYGARFIDDLSAGQTVRVEDVRADKRTRAYVGNFAAKEVGAFVIVPLMRSGRVRAFMNVTTREAHAWTESDVGLIAEVAERTWLEVERARAEADLRESEQRFRSIADTAPVLIWVTQQDRQRSFVNEAYVAFMGDDYETVRTADWRTYIHPDDQARVLEESLAGEATEQPFSMEARYRRHDGTYRWLKSFSRPRLGPGGEVVGFVGVAFDVTDIRESNTRLAVAAAERDAILGQLAEGVIVTDPKGKIVFVNEAAVRHHGVERLDVEPQDYSKAYQLLTEDGRPHPTKTLALVRAVRDGEVVTDARWRIRRPNGTEVLAVGSARPVTGPDGSRIGAVLTLRDETARINAEHRIAESEARFRTVADSAPAFIWMTDADTRVIFTNRRYKIVFGAEIGDLLGAQWMKLAHPDDVTPFSSEFMRAMKTHDRFQGMLRVVHKTLGVRWLRCEGVPRFDATGVFQGYVGASLDVTETKQAEDDLKRINELLEERVSSALVEKAKAEADLMHAQRMESIGRLTGGVAHDFNNLLTVVIGALDMILRSPDDAARRKKLGEAALAAARRGERLTHQLLAFSRRQALRPEPVDLNALIREIEPLLTRAVGESVALRLKLRRGGARVSVDTAQFEAALINLIVNARDAVGDKGRISIQTLACEVSEGEVVELAAGEYVCVTVSDNGAGMDAAVIGRVFEPFFTTKAVGKGTGLGLSQVYGFARQSGGGVRVLSTVGRGTEIRLYLPPLEVGQIIAPESEPMSSGELGEGRRLLLVEDDQSVAAIAIDLLESMGLYVHAVDTGPAALSVLANERFDVMLSDVVMPGGMTGIELARVCTERYPDMPIVLTSGYAGEDVDEALSDAPWPFLRKPYSSEQLNGALAGILPVKRAVD